MTTTEPSTITLDEMWDSTVTVRPADDGIGTLLQFKLQDVELDIVLVPQVVGGIADTLAGVVDFCRVPFHGLIPSDKGPGQYVGTIRVVVDLLAWQAHALAEALR